MIKQPLATDTVRFKCRFCGRLFKKASKCAEHIEKKSIINFCWPKDIITVTDKEDISHN